MNGTHQVPCSICPLVSVSISSWLARPLKLCAMLFIIAVVRAEVSVSAALALNTLANARHSAWVSIGRTCGCLSLGANFIRSSVDAAIRSRELSICWRALFLEYQYSSGEFRWRCSISSRLKWRMGCPSLLLRLRVYGTFPVVTNCCSSAEWAGGRRSFRATPALIQKGKFRDDQPMLLWPREKTSLAP